MSMFEIAVSRMTSVSGVALLDAFEHRQAVTVGKPVVEQHQIDTLCAPGQRLGGGSGLDNVVTFGLEAFGQRPANRAARRRR